MQTEQTRTAIVDAAVSLFQKQGYAATSLGQLIAESGESKGSIYFHFPGGKHEIAMAAATKDADQISILIDRVYQNSTTLYEAIDIICDDFSKRLKQTNYSGGCPLPSPEIGESQGRQPVCDKHEHWLTAIEASIDHYNGSTENSSSLAVVILSAIEGAVLLSQGRRNTLALESLPVSLKGLI